VIGNPILGTGFRGALNYIAQKDRAELLATNMAGRSPRELAREFGLVRQLRPKLGKAVCHMFFRPAPGEVLSTREWREVLDRALGGMGFESSPYAAYMHKDAGTDHLHIVASRIAYDGSVVSDSHNWPRMMRISAAIERDFGLRIVPRDGPVAAPKREETGRERRTGEASARTRLVELVDRAAHAGGSVSDFVARLRESGADILPAITSTGRVSGISFGLDGMVWKGSALGRAYSWAGLQRHFGLTYHHDLDRPALLAARAAAKAAGGAPDPPAAGAPGKAAEPPAPDPGDPGAPSGSAKLARDQVAAHLEAIGAARYTVAVVDARNISQELRTGWTAEQVLGAMGWLRHRNAAGADVLIRPQAPAERSLFVLAGVDPAALAHTEAAGCQPAAVVRVGAGECELWFRHPEAAPDVAAYAALRVAERLDLDAAATCSVYGHLAGFAVHGAEPPARDPDAPYATLASVSGREFEAAPELLSAAAREIEADVADALRLDEADRPVPPPDPLVDAAALYRDSALGVPWVEPNPGALLEALAHLPYAESQLAEEEDALLASTPEDLHEHEIAYEVTAADLRDTRLAVCGHSAGGSADLPPSDLVRHADLVYRLESARAEPSDGTRALEGRVAYLEDVLSAFRQERGLALPEEPPPREVFASLDAAYRSAASRVEELRASPPIAALRTAPQADGAALRSALADRLEACRDLARHDEHLARAFGQLEACRDQQALRLLSIEERATVSAARGEGLSAADGTLYTHTLAELSKTDAALRELEPRLLEARGAALGRALDHLRPAIESSPTYSRVDGYLALLARRHEVATFRAPRAEPLSPGQPVPTREAAARAANAANTARGRLDEARGELLARPSAEAVASLETSAAAHFAARSGLDRATAGDELRTAQARLAGVRAELASTSPGKPVEARYAETLAEVQAGSLRLDLLAPVPPHRASQGPEDLLARLRAGERSPALLQGLHRELSSSLVTVQGTVAPAVDPSYRPPSDLRSAVDRHVRTEEELTRLVDRLSAGGFRLSAPEIEAGRTTVLRYQLASSDLHRAAKGSLARSTEERGFGSFASRVVDSLSRQAYVACRDPLRAGGRHSFALPGAWRFVSASPRAYAAPFLGVATVAAARYANGLARDFVHEQVHGR
jgi:hypothetical protein